MSRSPGPGSGGTGEDAVCKPTAHGTGSAPRPRSWDGALSGSRGTRDGQRWRRELVLPSGMPGRASMGAGKRPAAHGAMPAAAPEAAGLGDVALALAALAVLPFCAGAAARPTPGRVLMRGAAGSELLLRPRARRPSPAAHPRGPGGPGPSPGGAAPAGHEGRVCSCQTAPSSLATSGEQEERINEPAAQGQGQNKSA